MINQWTGTSEILRVKPNGDFELASGVDPLVALGQLSKAFMKQQGRIKHLEECGDWLSTRVGWGEREQWNKAKEAKP